MQHFSRKSSNVGKVFPSNAEIYKKNNVIRLINTEKVNFAGYNELYINGNEFDQTN